MEGRSSSLYHPLDSPRHPNISQWVHLVHSCCGCGKICLCHSSSAGRKVKKKCKNMENKISDLIFRVLRYSIQLFIFPVIFLAVIFNIPRFYELETCLTLNSSRDLNMTFSCDQVIENKTSESCKIAICPTDLRKSFHYCRDYVLIANFVMMVLVPLLTLSTLNWHIHRFITVFSRSIVNTSSRQKRDQRIAAILIIIILVFTCCHVPRVVINVYEVRIHKHLMIIFGSLLTCR